LVEKAVEEEHNIDINYKAEACVYFYGGNIYVQLFGLPQLMLPSEKEFVDFHYQDSTDRPESISEIEWGLRKNTWNEIMKFNTFGENGLSFSFTPPYFGFDVARYIISLRK
jgi:hypothetical protein